MRLRVLLVLTAVGWAGGSLLVEASAAAAPTPVFARFAKDKKHKSKASKRSKRSKSKHGKKIALSPKGIRWGMTLEALSKLYEAEFDKEFLPLYKRVEPGPRMAELDNELRDKKALIKRNRIKFGPLPSGLDRTPLAGEFTHENDESATHVTLRNGVKRYFFFFGDHLWKIYEEHKPGKTIKLGSDFDEIAKKLQKKFGKAPQKKKADASKKRPFDEVSWSDDSTILRLVDRGGDKMGIVYVDKKIAENLDRYRTNKGKKKDTLDSDVAAVTKPVGPTVGGGAEQKDKKKK